MEDSTLIKRQKRVALICGSAFIGLYALALAFPGPLWGIHFWTFLPPAGLAILGSLALALFGLSFVKKEIQLPDFKGITPLVVILLPSILMGMLAWLFPITLDYLGDSHFIFPQIDAEITEWKPAMLTQLLDLQVLDPKVGERTFYAGHSLLAYLLGIKASEALWGMEIFFAMASVALWIWLVRKLLKDAWGQVIFIAAGLSAPFMQLFFRHYEVYYLPVTALLAFLCLLVQLFERPKRGYFFALLLLFIVLLKLHIFSWLLLPMVAVAGIRVFFPEKANEWVNWKYAFRFVIFPALILGAVGYLFVTNSLNGSRDFREDRLTDALFLPVQTSSEAPLDRYNLFSLNHLRDYANLPLLWSPVAAFLLVLSLFGFRNRIRWNNPLLIAMGISLLAFAAVLFLVNPLLSMPKDWDLFSLPAPLFMVFVLLLTAEVGEASLFRLAKGVALGISVLTMAWLFVNADADSLSRRYQKTGEYSFKTYWKGSTGMIEQGALLCTNPENEDALYRASIAELEPYAVPPEDVEFSYLVSAYVDQLIQQQRFEEAQKQLDLIETYTPRHYKLPYGRVICHFMKKEFVQAQPYLNNLVGAGYPDRQKALRIAVHSSVEAGAWEEAASFATQYLKQWPGTSSMTEVVRRVAEKDRLESLRLLFSQGN